MKILVVSDLHFEFHQDDGKDFLRRLVDADVIVIAGDLCPRSILAYSLDLFLRRYPKVIFVSGNHEFYHSSFEDVRTTLSWMTATYENLYVLDNTVEEIDGIRFVGTTMWTRKTSYIHLYEPNIADFSVIENSQQIYVENEKALTFLNDNVQENDVVVTHHLPTQESIAWKFKRSILNCFFLCDVQELIERRKPKLWIHGHTHASCDYEIGPTRVVCNPYGYVPSAINRKFKTNLIIEL